MLPALLFWVAAAVLPEAQAADEPPVELVTLRAGRHARHVSVELVFSGPFTHTPPAMSERTARLRLPNTVTAVKAYRKYRSFDGWLRFEPAGPDLLVAIGLPDRYGPPRVERRQRPERLILRFPETRPPRRMPLKANAARLVDLFGYPTPGGAGIDMTFSRRFQYVPLRIVKDTYRLRLPKAATDLKPFRPYRSFGGWLRIEPDADGLDIVLGQPEGLAKPTLERLEDPPRLRLRFARAPKAALVKAAEDDIGVRIAREPVAAPEVIDAAGPAPVEPPAAGIVAQTPPAAAPRPSSPASRPAAGRQPGKTGLRLDYLGNLQQIDMIRARIYSRQGRMREALKIYRTLRRRHPGDEEVWIDYVETVVNAGMFDLAQAELTAFQGRFPSSLRGERLQARLYRERGLPIKAYPVFEGLLTRYPADPGLWAAYGYTRLDANEWAPALNYFCRVLEVDPDNQDARRSVHAILRAHRPQLDTRWRSYRLDAGDTRTDTWSMNYRRHLDDALLLDVAGSSVRIDRPPQPGITGVDANVEDMTLMLRYRLSRRWQFGLGGGAYRGLGDGGGPAFGFEALAWQRAYLRGEGALDRPWYDPVEAAAHEGSLDRFRLTMEWAVADGLTLLLEGSQWDYRLRGPAATDVDDYGRKRTLTAALGRLILRRPDVYLGYQFLRSVFAYADPAFKPVGMIESETVHSTTLSIEHWPCTYWAWRLAGGLTWDTSRSVNSWNLVPVLILRLGNRIDLELRFEHSSESGLVDGGASDTINLRGKVIF